MEQNKKIAVQVAKEIMVKFIEQGRVSPTNFAEYFAPIYFEVLRTLCAEGLQDHGIQDDSDDGE